jgi:hypothetical protein
MKNEIVLKLNHHLASGIQNEAAVVYALTQVRKLLDLMRAKARYPVLAFYADWVVHPTLERQSWAKNGLQMLENVVGGFQTGKCNSKEVFRAVTGVLSFQRLHGELLKFGEEYGVAFDQMSFEQWRGFGTLLIGVLIDCPLQATSTVGMVRRLVLSRDFTFTHEVGQTLASWKIDLQDGTSMFGPIF